MSTSDLAFSSLCAYDIVFFQVVLTFSVVNSKPPQEFETIVDTSTTVRAVSGSVLLLETFLLLVLNLTAVFLNPLQFTSKLIS